MFAINTGVHGSKDVRKTSGLKRLFSKKKSLPIEKKVLTKNFKGLLIEWLR